MRIVLFEDSGSALHSEGWLQDDGHDVWRTMDFRDVMSWVEFNPGIATFDVWIFDLKVDAITLKRAEDTEPYDEGKHHSPSLYFIDHYLLKKCVTIKEKIILFSAYFSQYDRSGWDLGNYIRVDKHSQQVVDDLRVAVDLIRSGRNEK